MVRTAQSLIPRNSTDGITRFSIEDASVRQFLVRFFSKVRIDHETGCWLWQAGTHTPSGYGQFAFNRSAAKAHRLIYEVFEGPLPGDVHVHHECRVKSCVNFVRHLKAMPAGEHSRLDSPHAPKTHCPAGHPYSGENLQLSRDRRGYVRRHCRTCNKQRSREWRIRNKAKGKS